MSTVYVPPHRRGKSNRQIKPSDDKVIKETKEIKESDNNEPPSYKKDEKTLYKKIEEVRNKYNKISSDVSYRRWLYDNRVDLLDTYENCVDNRFNINYKLFCYLAYSCTNTALKSKNILE